MSGYLQRLVRTAARPAQFVHPFAGSIFAASHVEEPHGFDSEESVVADSPKGTRALPISPQQNAPEYNPRRETAPGSEYAPIAPIRPAIPPEPARGPVPAVQDQFVPLRAARTAPELEAQMERPLVPLSRKSEFLPLLPQSIAAVDARIGSEPFHAENRPPEPKRRPAAIEHATDDIQIHIGRIEVTAVHPPAPRAPKMPDRSLSLDAYLNRRTR